MKVARLAIVAAGVLVAGSALAQSTAQPLVPTNNAPMAVPGTAAPQAMPSLPAPASAPKAAMPSSRNAVATPAIKFEEIVGVPYRRSELNLWAIGAGAIGGVLAMNVLMPALGVSAVMTLPTTAAGLETVLAASRVYAATGIVAGSIAGQMLFNGLR